LRVQHRRCGRVARRDASPYNRRRRLFDGEFWQLQ
jgi:hypothetical protein